MAPTASGETGLFNVITADTLRRGDWSFGVYYQNWDLEAAKAPFIIPSARKNKNMGYDLYRLEGSVGYGVTDNWEISASLPYDRITGHGGDRNGFINGYYYQGKFSDSGMGPLHLATKFGFGPSSALAPGRLAVRRSCRPATRTAASPAARRTSAPVCTTRPASSRSAVRTRSSATAARSNSNFPLLAPDSREAAE